MTVEMTAQIIQLILAIVEVHSSHRAVEYEIRHVSSLGS